MLAKEIGIDLGSANIALVERNGTILAREPSVVAVDRKSRKVLAIGAEARTMMGRTPDAILPIQPMRGGVICDLDQTTALLRHMMRRVARSRWLRPRLILTAQSGMTDVEQRALVDAAMQAGAGEVTLIEKSIAAALGADLPVMEPTGSLVLDIGGGTTDGAVISLGSVVSSGSIPVAGDEMDLAILRHLRREQNLIIGACTAERVKRELGSATPPQEDSQLAVTGRHLVTGLPTTVVVAAHEVHAALGESLAQIDALLLSLLERTPPELLADISHAGVVLTGGSALLPGLSDRLSRLTGLAVKPAESAADAVAIGTGLALANRQRLRLTSTKRRR